MRRIILDMTAVTLDVIPRSLSFETGGGGVGPGSLVGGAGLGLNSLNHHMGGVIENNIYTPDPTVVVCLLENGLVVEVEISTTTTFAELNEQGWYCLPLTK